MELFFPKVRVSKLNFYILIIMPLEQKHQVPSSPFPNARPTQLKRNRTQLKRNRPPVESLGLSSCQQTEAYYWI